MHLGTDSTGWWDSTGAMKTSYLLFRVVRAPHSQTGASTHITEEIYVRMQMMELVGPDIKGA